MEDNNNIPVEQQSFKARFEVNPGSLPVGENTTESLEYDNFEYYQAPDRISRQSMITADYIPETGFRPGDKPVRYRNSSFDNSPVFYIPGRTSSEVIFTAIFDNDIFDYTDYYYTNGISFELFHPAVSAFPISRALPGLRNSLNYYGLVLVQNMYTPRKLEEQEVREGDRPFAAYLTITHQRISLSAEHRRRLQSEFVLGVIGPSSLGNVAQDLIHTNTPVGWVNQVENDFIVNYGIRFDQGIYSGKSVELAFYAGGQGGTLYDNLTGGFYFQLGKANDRYGSIFQTTARQKPFRNRVRYYFSLDLKNKLVAYDATLQGGMFNKESVYTFVGNQVSRYVFTGTASFGLGLGRYSLVAEQVYLSPEFEGGRKHLWFRIKNIININ